MMQRVNCTTAAALYTVSSLHESHLNDGYVYFQIRQQRARESPSKQMRLDI
jgi:hypothetical protein